MTEADVIALVSGLPGVVAVRASEDNGAPHVAWGDSFFFHGPDDRPENRRMPFATVVMHDCDGFDTASALNRRGVFRLNLAVGRERFEEVVGWAPAEYAAWSAGVDYAVLDTVVPHPVYAALDAIAAALLEQRLGNETAAQEELGEAIGVHDEV
jgi:Family of unknown function (DUF6194)